MDWPISWQKVKDNGGGSGSGLPVLDLREYVVSYDDVAPITDETVSALLDSAAQAESPIIAKFKTKPDSNGVAPPNEVVTICSVGYFADVASVGSSMEPSFCGYIPDAAFGIVRLDGRWVISCLAYPPATA